MGSDKSLTFIKAAQKVLEQYSPIDPMHYRQITQIALEKGWLETKGKTPYDTMRVEIRRETQKQKDRGELPQFIQYERGLVGLNEQLKSDLATQIEQHNEKIEKSIHSQLLEITPSDFEKLVGILLANMGFQSVEVTKYSNDGGIDIKGVLIVNHVIPIKMAVQVKRWKANVQAPMVQNLRGSLGVHEQGLIITTSDFSTGAKKEAQQPNKTPIALMNGKELVQQLITYYLGVKKTNYHLLELESDFFKKITEI